MQTLRPHLARISRPSVNRSRTKRLPQVSALTTAKMAQRKRFHNLWRHHCGGIGYIPKNWISGSQRGLLGPCLAVQIWRNKNLITCLGHIFVVVTGISFNLSQTRYKNNWCWIVSLFFVRKSWHRYIPSLPKLTICDGKSTFRGDQLSVGHWKNATLVHAGIPKTVSMI